MLKRCPAVAFVPLPNVNRCATNWSVDLLFVVLAMVLKHVTKTMGCSIGVLRFIMESGARGCEIIVSGKIRGQRAKAMKFVDGVMIHSGHPVTEYIQEAVRHVQMRQGLCE